MLSREEAARPPSAGTKLRCNLCGTEYPSAFRVCPLDGSPLLAAGSSDDSMIGAVLAGTFRVTKVLGEGGMGRVYEAEHVRLDRRYALKVIHSDFAGREDLLARFDREARAMGRVRSDHVVDVVDVLRTPDGRPCIAVELLVGRDLEAFLEEKTKLTVREALPLFRQMCRGLAAAHAQGVVHRDLKPSNLFLASDPGGGVTLKILDFGVAKLGGDDDKLTGTGAIVGTPAYMSPEQARGATDVDLRADVYAAGAVLYRMLTGKPPFDESSGGATLVKVLEETPPRPRSIEKTIPEGLEEVIEHAMARDPVQRYATIDELEVGATAFDSGGGTVVLDASRASVTSAASEATQDAKAMTAKAKRLRPGAVGAAIAAALGVGVAAGIALALLVDGIHEGARIGEPELVLVVIGSVVAFAATIATLGRSLRAHWRSAPLIRDDSERLRLAVMVGLSTFGALELISRVWAVVALMRPGAWDPLWAAARVMVAIGASAIAGAWGVKKSKS
jgi:serine/threonine-protein kinase